jgi:hypothetical protein
MSYYQLADYHIIDCQTFVHGLCTCQLLNYQLSVQTTFYRLSDYRSLSCCQGYRTHRPAEEQDPSAGDPRGEIPPRGGQNCGHEERQDHRGGNLPSAVGSGQGVRGFSHPVHTGISIEKEKLRSPTLFCCRSHGHNGYLLSFYFLSVADRGFVYIYCYPGGRDICHRQKLSLLFHY